MAYSQVLSVYLLLITWEQMLCFLLLDRITDSSVDQGIKSKAIQNSCVGIFSMCGYIFDKYSQHSVLLTCLQMKIHEWL